MAVLLSLIAGRLMKKVVEMARHRRALLAALPLRASRSPKHTPAAASSADNNPLKEPLLGG